MSKSNQLSDVLHVLLHMAEDAGPATSARLAAAMQTNPVVLRRLMSGLRKAGLVQSAKGHGGGWTLARPLRAVTLRDVHAALGAPALVSLGFREDRPQCLVAQAVNGALGTAMQEAEAQLLQRLGEVSLADLAADAQKRLSQQRRRGLAGPHRLQEHAPTDASAGPNAMHWPNPSSQEIPHAGD